MSGFWHGRRLIALLLLAPLAAAIAPSTAEAQEHKISAKLALSSLKVAPGKPIQGSVTVSHSSFTWAELPNAQVRVLICTAQSSSTNKDLLGIASNWTKEDEQQLIFKLLTSVESQGQMVFQKVAGPARIKEPWQPLVFPLDLDGTVLPRVSVSNPKLINQGLCDVMILAVLTGEDLSGQRFAAYASDKATVEVVPGLKTIEVLKAQVRFDDDPVLEGEEIHFDYGFRLSGLTPSVETPLRYEGTVLEKNPPKGQIPLRISKWGTKLIRGHADGSPMTREAVWKVTFPRPGDYEVTVEVSAPGFVPASATIRPNALRSGASPQMAVKKALVHVTKKAGASVPSGARPAPAFWILDRTEFDAKMEGLALRGGTLSGVSPSGFTCSYDQIEKISGGYGPNSLFKVTAVGTPPQKLKKGDKFQITISATGSKLGRDKCADGREPGEQASAYAKGSQSFRMTASPHANGMSDFDGSASVAVGGYGGQWFSSDSRTYSFEVLEAPGSGTIEITCIAAGLGVFARYVYKAEEAKTPPKPVSQTSKPQIKLEPDEEYPPLEAVLSPDVLSVSPRNAMGTPTELLIKGVRPNWKPVQVIIDTVDAFGALRINRRLKLQQGGSRLTADMWKANDGWFHWNLTALADLGIQPGIYTVPVTVKQEGHGDLRLYLTLRVSAKDAYGGGGPAPSTATQPRPSSFNASLDSEVIVLKPRGGRVKVNVLIEGLDLSSSNKVEVSFPQSDSGRLFGGLAVSPGAISMLAKDLAVFSRGNMELRQATIEFLAGPNSQPGEYSIEVLVKQEGKGEKTLTLTVRVEEAKE